MTAEKAVVRGERGGVRRLEHKMLRRGDEPGREEMKKVLDSKAEMW